MCFKKLIKSDEGYAVLLTGIFLAFGVVNMVHHEMWRDEIQAWLLARDSSSPIQLLKNIKYEGHPGLWHLYLFPFTRITKSPLMMKPLHLIIACLSVYLFARFSPFTRIQKALFAFGYFAFYEYCVICRNYALGMLLLFLFCVLFRNRHENFPLLGFVLFLAAHTSAHALILVISICVGLALDFLISRKYPSRAKLAFGYFWILLGIITAIIQLIPPSDTGWAVEWKTDFDLKHVRAVTGIISRVFIPIPKFTFHFWNTSILDSLPWSVNIELILGCLILIFCILLFIRKPAVLIMYLMGTLGLCVFYYTKYFGFMRHHGFVFISFITSAWIFGCGYEVKRLPNPFRKISLAFEKGLSKVLIAILFVHLVGGITAAVSDYMHVFAQAKATARFIKQNGLDKIPIVAGDVDHGVMSVVGYLETEVFYAVSDRWGTYIIWDEKRTGPVTDEIVLKKAKEISLKEGKNSLIISNHRILPSENLIAGYPLKEVAAFEKAIVDGWLYLYLLDPTIDRVSYHSITFSSAWAWGGTGGTHYYTGAIGSTAEYAFEGTGISWVGYKFDDAGRAEVSIDGKVIAVVDQYGPGRYLPFYWEHHGLSPGKHTIKITLLPDKNKESTACYINLTGFDVIQSAPSTGVNDTMGAVP